MTRYREISSAEMTSAQKEVHDEIVAGRRGRFGGPFEILIRAPEACRHLQRLGEYLRWGSSLPPSLSELAICLTARHLRVNLEWHAHRRSRSRPGSQLRRSRLSAPAPRPASRLPTRPSSIAPLLS